MKTLYSIVFLFVASIAFAQTKTESPYLEIKDPNSSVVLRDTKVDANISGTIALVHIQQSFQNTGANSTEATYVFPLSTQAAVHKMEMTVGNRKTAAKIFEKQKAKRVYAKAIQEGKRAAKMAQKRPNVFEMKVGNLPAQETIIIDIYYTEMLKPLDGTYPFVFPTIVGPRYQTESATESTFAQSNSKVRDMQFSLDLRIQAGMSIQNIQSDSHDVSVSFEDTCTANIHLNSSKSIAHNRDFILEYQLRGEGIQTGLLLYEHEDEKFFSYTVMPPKEGIKQDLNPREYLFVVDVSGSMMGYPIEVAEKLLRNLLGNMKENDRFNVLLFASNASVFAKEPVLATEENINYAIDFFQSDSSSGGGTELIHALKRAYELPRMEDSSARSMVIITDGYVTVEKEAFNLIAKNLDQANVFTFGIGTSVNRYLIEGMAKVGASESFIATSKEEATKVAKQFKKYIDRPLLSQIKLKTKGFEVYDLAYESIPDVFASRPVTILGKWKGSPKGEISIQGYQGKKRFKEKYAISANDVSTKNEALRYLWARKRIEALDDYQKAINENNKEAITALGLQYNLITAHTSFVAVADEIIYEAEESAAETEDYYSIGAAVSITETVKQKASLRVEITNTSLSKREKRNTIIQLKGNYLKQLKGLKKQYGKVRLHFSKNGNCVLIEKWENGIWKEITLGIQGKALELKQAQKESITFIIH